MLRQLIKISAATVLKQALAAFFILAILTCSAAYSASFDCSKASSRVEKLICEDDELSRLDKELALSYKRILESLVFASETLAKDRIQTEQRQWLKKERNNCSDTACLRLAYEARIKQLEDERDFSHVASNMTSTYKTALSFSSKADAERFQAEQDKWKKAIHDSCQDAACLLAAYLSRDSQLKKEAEQDIHQYWETDGYWYFYSKDRDQSSPMTLVDFNLDSSDALLQLGVGWTLGNIWVNGQRFATQKEIEQTPLMSSGTPSNIPQLLCNGDTVKMAADQSSPKFGDPITRIVIRTPQQADDYWCKECRSFAIFQKQDPPQIFKGVREENHQDSNISLDIPLRSKIYQVEVLNDCTILAVIDRGVIRFRADGTTDAVLPPGMLLVDGADLVRWETEFFQQYKGELKVSLQSKLLFFYDKIFGGERR